MPDNTNRCYFEKTLRLIDKLQKNCECREELDNTCSRPFLGALANFECYNTRPINFYGCDNNLITVDYSVVVGGETLTGRSGIFRVEKVEDCCAICTILIENPDTDASTRPFITTNQTATINLKCVCAIKCLTDTIVDL